MKQNGRKQRLLLNKINNPKSYNLKKIYFLPSQENVLYMIPHSHSHPTRPIVDVRHLRSHHKQPWSNSLIHLRFRIKLLYQQSRCLWVYVGSNGREKTSSSSSTLRICRRRLKEEKERTLDFRCTIPIKELWIIPKKPRRESSRV